MALALPLWVDIANNVSSPVSLPKATVNVLLDCVQDEGEDASGTRHVLHALRKLKILRFLVLNASRSADTIDQVAAALPTLQALALDSCPGTTHIPPSFQHLAQLFVEQCHRVTRIPPLQHLTWLTVHRCNALAALPQLPALTHLDVNDCPALTAIHKLPRLKKLYITRCHALATLPTDLPNLHTLEISRSCDVEHLPALPSLKTLVIHGNNRAVREVQPPSVPQLQRFTVDTCDLVSRVEGFTSLKELVLIRCSALVSVAQLPRLTHLCIERCRHMMQPMVDLPALQTLACTFSAVTQLPESSSMRALNINACRHLTAIPVLPGLTQLNIDTAKALTSLPELPALQLLDICSTHALCAVPTMPAIKEMSIQRCSSLSHVAQQPELALLHVEECPMLVSIAAAPKLKALVIAACPKLDTPPTSPPLASLRLSGCCSLRSLPSLEAAAQVDIRDCKLLSG